MYKYTPIIRKEYLLTSSRILMSEHPLDEMERMVNEAMRNFDQRLTDDTVIIISRETAFYDVMLVIELVKKDDLTYHTEDLDDEERLD